MPYYTFLWFDWVLLAVQLGSCLLAYLLPRQKNRERSIYGIMLSLVFFLLFCFGFLFWDVFPLALCIELLSLYYFVTVFLAFAKNGKNGGLSALNAYLSAYFFVKGLLFHNSKK